MILVDMNQIGVASVMMHLNITKRDSVDVPLVRHMILNSLRMFRQMFREEYRDFFPEYKASRKKTRETSGHNWNDIFDCLNTVKEELIEFFPYKVLEVYGAEADDIIAALCLELEFDNGKTLILSGDKDFVQLQKYTNVSQYSPITKKFVEGVDPNEYLCEHILKGDVSDGIPNVLSPDNTFVDGLRQRPLSKKKLADILEDLNEGELLYAASWYRNYQRNQKLIDLKESPKELFLECLESYHKAPEGDRSKLLNYFIDNKLKELMDNIGDF